MKRQPNSAFAVINYGRTMHVCMDIHCPCGFHNHLDTWGDMGSAEYVRCADCKDVLRIGADVNLLDKREDFDIKRDAYTFIQWKGTDVVMQANCTCGKTFDIEQDFAYECDCPHCGKHYHCESCLEVTKLTPEEAALVTHVQEPEKDYEDMNDEERAAYDAKMETLAAEQAAERRQVLAGLGVIGCEVGRQVAVPGIMQPLHVFEMPLVSEPPAVVLGATLVREALRKAPPVNVVMLGDFVDGGIGSRLLSAMLPSNHEPVGPDVQSGRIVVLPDIHVPAADDRNMRELRRFIDSLGNGGSGNRRQRRRRNKK